VIDKGFNDRQGNQMDNNKKLLLREVMLDNHDYQSMPTCEGGTNINIPGVNPNTRTRTYISNQLPTGMAG